MRISDWSSDGCSSDLVRRAGDMREPRAPLRDQMLDRRPRPGMIVDHDRGVAGAVEPRAHHHHGQPRRQIGGEEISVDFGRHDEQAIDRSEEHTSELQSLMRISYAVFCLKKKNKHSPKNTQTNYK